MNEIEQQILSTPRQHPPTPGNPVFIIDVGRDFAVGAVFASKERAERVAEQLGLNNYSIREEAA